MTHMSSKDIYTFTVGGYKLLGYSTQLGLNKEALTEQADVLGDDWVYHDPIGLKQAAMTQAGFFDSATLASHDALTALFGTRAVGALAIEGGTALDPVLLFDGVFTGSDNWNIPRGELAKLDVGYTTTGEVETGKILLPWATKTTDGDDSGQDTGETGTVTGGIGYLFVYNLVFDTATGLEVSIMESDDGGADPYAEIIGFTEITDDTAGVGSERVAVASGTVGPFLQVEWTFTGTEGAGDTADIFVCFIRTPDPV